MVAHQIHFGKKFYQDKKTGYWISTTSPRIRAHVWVWTNEKYNVPKGCHIHHKNQNKSDNSIENLELMDRTSHLKLHMQSEERRQKSREYADKYRPLTKEWHGSPEGLAWHKYHAEKCKFGKWEPKEFTCVFCNKKYITKKLSRTYFCSNNCKSAHRRANGLDDIQVPCEKCGTIFIKNKYAKRRFCSRMCSY